jgi:hypothetical protein
MRNENLWKDYQFLTREMSTFLAKQELDMFYELLDQRQSLQAMIDETGDYEYLFSEAGQELVQEVQQEDVQNSRQLRGSMTRMQQQRQVRNAYQARYSSRSGERTDFSG